MYERSLRISNASLLDKLKVYSFDPQVQCEKSFMRVSVEFDRPFYGMIFSKGYYRYVEAKGIVHSLFRALR